MHPNRESANILMNPQHCLSTRHATYTKEDSTNVRSASLKKEDYYARNSSINRTPTTVTHKPITVSHTPTTVTHKPTTVSHTPTTVTHTPPNNDYYTHMNSNQNDVYRSMGYKFVGQNKI